MVFARTELSSWPWPAAIVACSSCWTTAVTGAVTAELLRRCDQVVLNVRSDNPPALQAYARLGYREHLRFEERLVHRTGPAWAGITAPLRRLLSHRES